MEKPLLASLLACLLLVSAALADGEFSSWPPRKFLIDSIVDGVPAALKAYHPDTGRFGTEPWVCGDQNVIFALATAWATEHPDNPYYDSDELLTAAKRSWMPRTRRACGASTRRTSPTGDRYTCPGPTAAGYAHTRWSRMPSPRPRERSGRRASCWASRASGAMPTAGCAGAVFDNQDWRDAATRFMARAVEKQDPAGYWSEHFGPVIGYNAVYVEALGIYYAYSNDPVVLEALQRSARFHSAVLLPDGSSISCIDERQVYHRGISRGNVGFSWTPEGRGFLLQQYARFEADGGRLINADEAATLLLYSGEGDAIMPPAGGDSAVTTIGDNDAAVLREKPWAWAVSGYACDPPQNRWIQDRHNHIDVFHDELGLIIGGGNTKLQPYWSTFTVGDASLLKHTAGDENPNFIPEIALKWTADAGRVATQPGASRLKLTYADVDAISVIRAGDDESLTMTYMAPAGKRVEAHVPFMRRAGQVHLADGRSIKLTEEQFELDSAQIGDHFRYGNLRVSVPAGASLRWPAWQHNPYTKDGNSPLGNAKLVLVLPFDTTDRYDIRLSHEAPPPFPGLAFEARDLQVEVSETAYTKRLDDLGSQLLGRSKVGDTITFALPEVPAGRYELIGDFVLASMYAIVDVHVDGARVGESFDAYAPGVDADGTLVSFGEVDLKAGPHTITVTIVGQNEKSEGTIVAAQAAGREIDRHGYPRRPRMLTLSFRRRDHVEICHGRSSVACPPSNVLSR